MKCNKLQHLNKRPLRIVLDEKSLHYQEPLSRFNSTDLYSIRCQHMMKTVFKTIQFETMPKYTRGRFQMRNTEIKETCYPIHQYSHLWSSLLQIYFCKHVEQTNRGPEVINQRPWMTEFRPKICQISFEHQCNCYLSGADPGFWNGRWIFVIMY